MPHFSEMSFLFDNNAVGDHGYYITDKIVNLSNDNTVNIMKNNNTNNKYTVYKGDKNAGTNKIKKFLEENVYKHSSSNNNPYINLVKDFNDKPSMKIKPSDLAYLRDLGVYPLNRMAILRRFPGESYLPENLEDTDFRLEPISTIIGWIKPDETFGKIDFNETWNKTNKRFDSLLIETITKQFGVNISAAVPIPDFLQGVVWQVYSKMGLSGSAGLPKNEGEITSYSGAVLEPEDNVWGLKNIPIGNPDLLMEGPYRDPTSQNIQSNFTFNLTTTYEQKLIGDVDPGSAMLDILDNIYAMGTSDMVFYWNENSEIISDARGATKDGANSIKAWFEMVKTIAQNFWDAMQNLFSSLKESLNELIALSKSKFSESDQKTNSEESSGEPKNIDGVPLLLDSILTSTLAIHRYHFRASIELMTGGKYTNAPWHLTIGNPYSPWLSTNHIIVKSCSIETSKELGFNDQPQWLTATFTCEFSRALGKQELMRMFNNTYKRTYSNPQK